MARLTETDKIDLLLAVVRNTPPKPNMAKVAEELGINTPAASMRLNALKKEGAQRLQENANGGKIKNGGTPKKSSGTLKKSGGTTSKSKKGGDGGEGMDMGTSAKKRKFVGEDDDEEGGWEDAVEQMEEYLIKVEEGGGGRVKME